MEEDLFGGFILFGREILGGIEEEDHEAIRFKWLLGEINTLFNATHGIVVAKLREIESAPTLEDAKQLIRELRHEPLTDSFRAQGLCEAFEALGQGLGALAYRTEGQHASQARDMASTLMSRESEVALLYIDNIKNLSTLLMESDQNTSLKPLQKLAQNARRELTNQTADFRSLANSFRRIMRST